MNDWTILCDFDGTIAVDDTTDTLLARFGRAGWEALEADWRAGRIGSRECMAGQVALLDMDHAELDAHLAERELDPGFRAFVAAARAEGMHVEVVSDGLDYAIRSILGRQGLDWLPITSNRLQPVGMRNWQLEFPHAASDCRVVSGTCKCARASAARRSATRVLLIGDSASDFCVAEAADFVFAKGKLVAHCIDRNIPHAPIRDFAEVTALLPRLLSGELTAVDDAGPTVMRAATA